MGENTGGLETALDKPHAKENEPQSSFEKLQAFLQQSGELVTHTITGTDVQIKKLKYHQPNVTFATRLKIFY